VCLGNLSCSRHHYQWRIRSPLLISRSLIYFAVAAREGVSTFLPTALRESHLDKVFPAANRERGTETRILAASCPQERFQAVDIRFDITDPSESYASIILFERTRWALRVQCWALLPSKFCIYPQEEKCTLAFFFLHRSS